MTAECSYCILQTVMGHVIKHFRTRKCVCEKHAPQPKAYPWYERFCSSTALIKIYPYKITKYKKRGRSVLKRMKLDQVIYSLNINWTPSFMSLDQGVLQIICSYGYVTMQKEAQLAQSGKSFPQK